MSTKLERWLFWLAVVTLLGLHMLGFGQGGRPLWLGWMPLDLVYRVAWMAAAAALVVWSSTTSGRCSRASRSRASSPR